MTRMYFKRNLALLDYIIDLDINGNSIIFKDEDSDEYYWIYESGESFHGEIDNKRNMFIFNDSRLPHLEIPLIFMTYDFL